MALFLLQYRNPEAEEWAPWVTCWAEIKYIRTVEARDALIKVSNRMQISKGAQFRIFGPGYVYYLDIGELPWRSPTTMSHAYRLPFEVPDSTLSKRT